jgi:hypothetical protein
MTGQLKKLFDEYSLSARVKPVFFAVFPVVLFTIYWYSETRTWGGGILTFLTSFGVIAFFANQISTSGNVLQKKLYKKWGGAPTTIAFRKSDDTFDTHTKTRYLKKILVKVDGVSLPSEDLETENPTAADEVYRTASEFLKENTRDTKTFPLVFKELVNYGYSRNLLSIKGIGITIVGVTSILNVFMIWFKDLNKATDLSIDTPSQIPFLSYGATIAFAIILLLWIFGVTESWVKIRGFCYARALISASEKM